MLNNQGHPGEGTSCRQQPPGSNPKDLSPYIAELKKHGLKATKARLAVLACLAASERPLTPVELMRQLQGEAGSSAGVDQVSVYRILEAFYQLELVHHVQPSRGYLLCKHRRCHAGLHILTYCQSCGAAEEKEVPFEILGSLVWYLKNQGNFQPKDHFFQIAGLCQQCADH